MTSREDVERVLEAGRAGIGLLIALLVVAGIVVAGVVPRIRARAALRTTTNEIAVPTVEVMQPKEGSPQAEIVLPGTIEAFVDSPPGAQRRHIYSKH